MLNNNAYVFQLIGNGIYKLNMGKYRIEWNGGIVFTSSCACSDIYFMNPRAAKVFTHIDGIKTLYDVAASLQQLQPNLNSDDVVLDIIKTIRFLGSVRAIQLIKKGGSNEHQ